MTTKRKCKECGSTNGYTRLETRDKVCRACGAITPLKSKPHAPHATVEAVPNPDPKGKNP